jgi:hypothetical protein
MHSEASFAVRTVQSEVQLIRAEGIDSSEPLSSNQADQCKAGAAERSLGSGKSAAPQHCSVLGRLQVQYTLLFHMDLLAMRSMVGGSRSVHSMS